MRWKEFVEAVEKVLNDDNPNIEYIDISCGYGLDFFTEIHVTVDEDDDSMAIL